MKISDPYKWINRIIFAIAILAALWFFRPWFHGFVMGFYKSPLLFEIIIVWLILHFAVFRKKGTSFNLGTPEGPKLIKFNIASILVIVLLIFISPIFSQIAPQMHVVNNFEFNKISTLPETNDNIRLMPFEVAHRYSKDSLQLSQFRLGTENIANNNGKLSWVFPLVPDGGILSLIKKNKGIVMVDATSQEKSTKMKWKDFSIGEGMKIFDNLWWNNLFYGCQA